MLDQAVADDAGADDGDLGRGRHGASPTHVSFPRLGASGGTAPLRSSAPSASPTGKEIGGWAVLAPSAAFPVWRPGLPRDRSNPLLAHEAPLRIAAPMDPQRGMPSNRRTYR